MTGFRMDDYVDVAERIREFSEKYPDGSLQSEIVIRDNGILCKAYAYRTPDDEKPGIGHAFEVVPGKTPYTKDSEVMNAETSAWGRAIVALGFDTKKIASAQEVRNRQGEQREPAADDARGLQGSRADAGSNGAGASDKQKAMIRRLTKKLGFEEDAVDSLSKQAASARIEELLALEAGEKDAVAVGGGSVDDPTIPF